ncbi:uncharacterized protein CDAR_33111 [Caerostris darwini]|uniref:Uncharacterized protein n=1 Tax=Caerostris darwini TaxID=1538125 RepID=A0AAV4SN10_9ARAC|nr:uncharacterized protein CDAR_33111 [Caerostris darwini]
MKIVLPKCVYKFLKNVLYFFVEQFFKQGEIHFGIGRNYSENNNVRGDLFTKHLVENIVSDRVKKYDPYRMDETTVYTKLANLEFGKITLRKGLLTGLSTLHPTTICTLNESEGKLEINTNLGAGPLQYQGETLIGFGRYSRKAILSLCLLHIRIIMDFDIDKETGRKGRLFDIFITEMKGFRLRLHGFGCLDLPINLGNLFELLQYYVLRRKTRTMNWLQKISFLVIVLQFSVQIHRTVGFLDDEDDNVVRGDKYIDDLLDEMIEQNGHEYDPYILEDSVIGFSKKIVFVNVSGEAKLHNGYITGLKSLHRPEHCSVEEEDGELLVKADLGAGVLNFHYDGTVKFMNFGPTITVHGELHYLETHMEFTVDAKTGRNGELKKFVIDDMKGMKITVTGLGPMNWAMNYIISGVTTIFQGFIRNFMQKKIRSHIAERLPNYQFPVEGGNIDITEVPEITEAPKEPETEAPKEPETEAPEEIVPETEAPEEIVPETEAPEEVVTDSPEQEALEAMQLFKYLDLL